MSKEDWKFLDKIQYEAEVTGMYLTANPLDYIKQREVDLDKKDFEGSVYLSFLELVKKKTQSGDTYFLATANNKTSQSELRLGKRIVDKITKYNLLQKHNGDIEKVIKDLRVTDKKEEYFRELEPIEPLSKFKVYEVFFEIREFKNKDQPSIKNWYVSDIKEVEISKDGFLVYRVEGLNKKYKKQYEKILTQNKGEDVARLVFEDNSFVDISNILFMRGTTQNDLFLVGKGK